MVLVKTVSFSLCSLIFSLHWAMTVERPRQKVKNYYNIKLVKLERQKEENPSNCIQMIYYFICFQMFACLLHEPKSTSLNKIYTSRSKSILSEVNISPTWINTLVHILLDYMVDLAVCSSVLIYIITSNTITLTVVPFLLVHKIWKKLEC